MLGIHQTRTSAYHPQGNAQVEHFNCTLEVMLAKTVKDNQQYWVFPNRCWHTGLPFMRPQATHCFTLCLAVLLYTHWDHDFWHDKHSKKESTVPDCVSSLNRFLKTVCPRLVEVLELLINVTKPDMNNTQQPHLSQLGIKYLFWQYNCIIIVMM